jgi:putative endonuclease
MSTTSEAAVTGCPQETLLSTDHEAGLAAVGSWPHGRGMTSAKDAVGAYGERVAARLLVSSGMRLLDRNWRCELGELDIVALDGDTIVFCEVKARRGDTFGAPVEAVGPTKTRRLRALAARWLAEHPHVRGPVRFDVVSVRPRRAGAAVVEHLRGAF